MKVVDDMTERVHHAIKSLTFETKAHTGAMGATVAMNQLEGPELRLEVRNSYRLANERLDWIGFLTSAMYSVLQGKLTWDMWLTALGNHVNNMRLANSCDHKRAERFLEYVVEHLVVLDL